MSDDIVQEGTPLYGASIMFMTALVCAVEDALRVLCHERFGPRERRGHAEDVPRDPMLSRSSARRLGFGSLIEAARNVAPDDLALSGLVPAPAVAELADDAEPEPA